jgi:pilus assembly protein CpaE
MATQFNLAGATNKASIAVTTVGLDPISCRALANFMEGVPGAAIASNIDGYSGAEREVGRAGDHARLRLCFIDYDKNTDQAIWITEHLRTNYPDVHIFAVSANTEPDQIIAAMRVGCTEYLVKPIQNDRVMDGFARVEAKQKERTRSKIHGKVITVIGAKGGAGVTSLALHLALELTGKEQRKCVLVDQHAALGDASLYLGTGRHQYSFYELANNTDRLDQELLQGFLLRHSSGLHVLDSPETVDAIHMVSPSAVEHTLSFLAETYQFVVVDCPPGLSDLNLACISQSDEIAIVMTAELPSVRNAVRYMEHLERLGYSSSKVQIVLNRHSMRGPLADDRIEKALGQQISLRVPNNYNEVIRAINSGAPIPCGKTEFGTAIQKWAREISSNSTGQTAMAAAQSHAGGMRSLFGK